MPFDENNGNQPKPKRKYERKPPAQFTTQAITPNPQIAMLETDYVGLVRQRSAVATKVNQANMQLQFAQNELSQIDGDIQFLANSIAQLKNGGMPVPTSPYVAQNLGQPQYPNYNAIPSAPYNPVQPFPTMPPFEPGPGVGSYPAQNRGLYPDATDRLESAEDIRRDELGQRGQ